MVHRGRNRYASGILGTERQTRGGCGSGGKAPTVADQRSDVGHDRSDAGKQLALDMVHRGNGSSRDSIAVRADRARRRTTAYWLLYASQGGD